MKAYKCIKNKCNFDKRLGNNWVETDLLGDYFPSETCVAKTSRAITGFIVCTFTPHPRLCKSLGASSGFLRYEALPLEPNEALFPYDLDLMCGFETT